MRSTTFSCSPFVLALCATLVICACDPSRPDPGPISPNVLEEVVDCTTVVVDASCIDSSTSVPDCSTESNLIQFNDQQLELTGRSGTNAEFCEVSAPFVFYVELTPNFFDNASHCEEDSHLRVKAVHARRVNIPRQPFTELVGDPWGEFNVYDPRYGKCSYVIKARLGKSSP